MIKISNLYKSYGETEVLKNISLEIKKGEIYGLIGRSGAGKSTLLRCINKLEDFQSGSVIVDGEEISDLQGNRLKEFRKNIGMIFQNFSLMQRKTAYENIALPMECWGYDKSKIHNRVKELAEIVGIADKLNSKPRELSGGQQQRVAIARALSLDSKVLLSDEATSALDPKTTDSILNLLKEINKNLGITIVIVAHQMSIIKQLCDKVTVLDKGEMVIDGYVEDVFLRKHFEVNEILGGGENITLPKTGLNLRINISESERAKRIIARIPMEVGIQFSIPWANVEQYKDQIFASFIINISNDDYDKISSYLATNKVDWEEINNG